MFDKFRFWFLRLVYEPVFNWFLSSNFPLCINLKLDQEGNSNQKKQPCLLTGKPKNSFTLSPRDAVFINIFLTLLSIKLQGKSPWVLGDQLQSEDACLYQQRVLRASSLLDCLQVVGNLRNSIHWLLLASAKLRTFSKGGCCSRSS